MQSPKSTLRNASSNPNHDDVLAKSIPEAIQSEIDDLVARAETFVGDEDEPVMQVAEPEVSRKPAPRYMHGVMRGEQAYLTTNLQDKGSVTLLQPQLIWTMGRHRDAGIMVKDRMMSRRHASIVYRPQAQAFYLIDLNSLNGCYVNGLRVDQQRLEDGDLLRIGNTECFFFISSQCATLPPLHREVQTKVLSAFSKSADSVNA